jgi:tetratricopeptide (TPR) repeat protein
VLLAPAPERWSWGPKRYDRAVTLASWEATYWMGRGDLLLRNEDVLPQAPESFEEAVRRAPGRYAAASRATDVARGLGKPDLAARYYEHLLTIEPTSPGAEVEVARFEFQRENYGAGYALSWTPWRLTRSAIDGGC